MKLSMKRVFGIVFFLIIFNASATNRIEGDFVETDHQLIYLYEGYLGNKTVVDSAEIKNGEFRMKLEKEINGLYFLGFDEKNLLSFIAEEPTISIAFSNDKNLSESLVTPVQPFKALNSYLIHTSNYDQEMNKINQEFVRISKTYRQDAPEFQELMTLLKSTWDSLHAEDLKFYSDLTKNNKSKFAQRMGEFFDRTGATKATYLKESDFTDSYFSRGDFLQRKLNYYLMVFVQLNQSTAFTELNAILAKAPKGSPGREQAYISVISTAFNLDQNVAKQLSTMYKQEYPSSPEAKKFASYFPPGVNDDAPEIALKDPSGNTYELSSLKGKVVLLDFWASWCGPCIREMPNVVKAYEKYKSKGFEIYSVSLDSNKDRWKAAIDRFGMTWPNNVSDLKKWQSAPARQYGVTGIPATFLIDEEGKIVAKNLRGAALEQKLEEYFSAE